MDLSFRRLNWKTFWSALCFYHLLHIKLIHSVRVLHTEWHAEEEKRVWWYLCRNLKPTTPLIGRLRSSCLVTTFYDAIRTCCNEKFKLTTTELFSGTSAWDIDVLWDVWIRAGSRASNKSYSAYRHTVGIQPSLSLHDSWYWISRYIHGLKLRHKQPKCIDIK